MTYQNKMKFLLVVDVAIILFSVWSAYFFVFKGNMYEPYIKQMYMFMAVYVIIGILVMRFLKMYHHIWKYASVAEVMWIFNAVSLSFVISWSVTTMVSDYRIPWSVSLLVFETTLLLTGSVRLLFRIVKFDGSGPTPEKLKNILIIGAGNCARFIIQEIKTHKYNDMKPVLLIDDDPNKRQMHVKGIKVYGGRDKIIEAVEKYDISEIIIAIPSAHRREIQEIIDICKQTKAKLKIIPKINDFICNKVSLSEIRNVDVEDLLRRESIQVDLEEIANYVKNKVVLVTGAGGSIGSELCRQIAPFHPQVLLLLGHGENSIYHIEMELMRLFPKLHIETIIADVQDQQRINHVFQTHRPQVVFHAAAHKHVPMMERNPTEAIKNNIIGTKNVAQAADRFQTERFVLISTDKAVNPSSVMGATKRMAELLIMSMNTKSRTIYAAVRFGNVVGSSGSVIPKFKEQIMQGGPVTVTHPEMTRYFMTIPEAVQLVIQAGSYAKDGEIFILDMGKPIKILDLARDLIRFSGFEPDQDVKIVFSGIRAGEKLHEELFTDEEAYATTVHNRIFVSKSIEINLEKLEDELVALEDVFGDEMMNVREIMKQIIHNYQQQVS